MRYVSSAGHSRQRRPGVVLLVVMAMLALFASVALSFVFYADAEAIAARANMDQMVPTQADIDAEELAAYFLQQLLYPTDNIYSAMRGWDLARSIYGYDPANLNFIPYNGVGRMALQGNDPTFTNLAPPAPYKPYSTDNFMMVNYATYHNPLALPADKTVNFSRTPEFLDKVSFPPTSTPPSPSNIINPPLPAPPLDYKYVGGANPPWTAYDTNSLFLAQADAAGNVYMPSFYRPWMTSSIAAVPNNPPFPPGTQSLYTKLFKYVSLFPQSPQNNGLYPNDPNVWNPNFLLPDNDGVADVRNLDFGPGGNDSKWMDLGFPVMTAPNGKRYKALFAPLVMDLANRLHLWAHGNRLGVSNQGFGPNEVNLNALPGASPQLGAPLQISGLSQLPVPTNTVTVTTTTPHSLIAGQWVNILGAPSSYNGFYLVTNVLSPTSFTYTSTQTLLPTYPTALGAQATGTVSTAFGVPIVTAKEAANKTVTVTTSSPHNLSIGKAVVIAGATVAGYNGIYAVTNVVSPVQFQYLNAVAGLVPMAAATAPNGTASSGEIFALRYGGSGGNAASVPTAVAQGFLPTIPMTPFDSDGLDTTTGLSSNPFFFPFNYSTSTLAALTKGVHVVSVANPINTTATPNGFPWALQPGMQVVVDLPPNQEVVKVTAVTLAPATFTATFTKKHVKGVPVVYNGGFSTLVSPPMVGSPPGAPALLPSGWLDYTGTEMTSNPLGFNMSNVFAAPYSAPLPPSNLEALVRWGGTNAPALTSDIFRRMPPAFSNVRTRNMVTVSNWHMDRVTGAPFLNFDRTTAGNYQLSAGNFPTLTNAGGQTVTYATIGSKAASVKVAGSGATNPPWKNEYSADWRSNLGTLLRVDLTRKLTAYSPPATAAQAKLALADRQELASDLYNALVRVTGAQDPNILTAKTVKVGTTDYLAARWLAQLAVNIVDYLDNDSTPGSEAMTAFEWFKGFAGAKGVPAVPAEYVFGTELPALVLNEAYAQQEGGQTGQVNVFAELLNPLLNNTATALLQNGAGGQNYYQIEVYNSPPAGGIGTYLNNNQGSGPAGAALTIMNQWNPAGASAQETVIATKVLPGGPGTVTPAPVIHNIAIRAEAANANNTGAQLLAGGIAKIHTVANHGLTKNNVGAAVTITGIVDAKANPIPQYDGTFVITKVSPGGAPFWFEYAIPGAGVLPHGGNGNAMWVQNANGGYYVAGPSAVPYTSAARVPNLPVTLATPLLSFNPPKATIAPINKKNPALDGLREVGTTVTVTTTAPLPASFYVGSKFVLNTPPPSSPLYNGTFTIATINPARTSFTYTDTNAKAVKLGPGGVGTVTLVVQNVAMLLRRIADPNQAFNAVTNPFVTVDYIDNVPVNSAAATFLTSGRAQPFSANLQAPAGNTFFAQNVPNSTFDVLIHLDRPPVNPLELLFVSGFRPHLLTQQFVSGPNKQQHYAPWNPFMANSNASANSLIFRALDQMSSHYMAGLYAGGRNPGNINLNTVMDQEVFNALCDAPNPNSPQHPYAWFTQNDVNTIWTNLLTSRGVQNTLAPSADPSYTANPATALTSPPFKSFSAASSGGTASYNETWLRNNAAGTPLFGVGSSTTTPPSHPYVQASLLQKIYNNITTTSNVFAVWWTVGYFEVVDESVQPARLGQEIGRSQNTNIRHRFFAVVDRSGMQIGTTTTNGPITKNAAAQAVAYNPATASNMTGNAGAWAANQSYAISNIVTAGAPAQAFVCIKPNINQAPLSKKGVLNVTYWQNLIQPGMLLEVVDTTGAFNTEVVSVQATAGSQFTAVFLKNHAANSPIIIRGNPGPQSNYSPHKDTNVVLHLSVIK